MATGSHREDEDTPPDVQGDGQSVGVPADGELEGSSYNPLGGSTGMKHWQAGYIEKPGFADCGNVFFAAVEMTRMPMVGSLRTDSVGPTKRSNISARCPRQHDKL